MQQLNHISKDIIIFKRKLINKKRKERLKERKGENPKPP
jgi:hypothetical protein